MSACAKWTDYVNTYEVCDSEAPTIFFNSIEDEAGYKLWVRVPTGDSTLQDLLNDMSTWESSGRNTCENNAYNTHPDWAPVEGEIPPEFEAVSVANVSVDVYGVSVSSVTYRVHVYSPAGISDVSVYSEAYTSPYMQDPLEIPVTIEGTHSDTISYIDIKYWPTDAHGCAAWFGAVSSMYLTTLTIDGAQLYIFGLLEVYTSGGFE